MTKKHCYLSLLILMWTALLPTHAGTCGVFAATSNDSLHRMVGQMIMVGFRGSEASRSAPVMRQIADVELGGVVLFDYDVEQKSPVRNVVSPDQLRRLVSSLQAVSRIPLFVAIDQEGGRVARLKPRHGFTAAPSQQFLGELNILDSTRAWARRTAAELSRAGINLNFAPVLDLNVNPDNPVIGGIGRSFGADPDVVTLHGRAVAEALRGGGVLSAVKHFPGHGSSRADSHQGFVDVSDTWNRSELLPFAALIREHACDMVMSAHIFNRNLDTDYPATLSRHVMSGLLRDSLGFQGVIVSDDMQMRAITDSYGLETSIERALLAGVDILLFGNNAGRYDPDIAVKASAIVSSLVKSGRVPRALVEQSYRRIMALKERIRKK